MKIEVILTENVKHKGYIGDIVSVTLGYARNFLFRNGLAVKKNEQTLKMLSVLQQKKQAILAKEKADYEAIAAMLNGRELLFVEKIHDDNKLYGSISATELVQKIKDSCGVELEKKQIQMPNNQDHIKMIGSYDIAINLHTEVLCTIKLSIEAEAVKEEAKKAKK